MWVIWVLYRGYIGVGVCRVWGFQSNLGVPFWGVPEM